MKTLTLAAVAIVALLGFFIVGCDESQTMMEQVTRETAPAPEEEVTVEETPPASEEVTVEETPPASDEETIAKTFPSRRGEVTLAETSCATDFCLVGISYTNDANTDGSGQLTLYFDIPDALGPGPHRVLLRHPQAHMETDIPFENKQFLAGKDSAEIFFHRGMYSPYTESILFLDPDDKIVFKYRIPIGNEEAQIVIGDAISDYAPGAVPVGDPNSTLFFDNGVLDSNYPYWEGDEELYHELLFSFYGGIRLDLYGQ